ncbi:MAG: spore maturation protein CgeB [Alphaproteobacteria bacterium]|jgi:spore maturation protein CgeB
MKVMIASDGHGGQSHGFAYGDSFKKLGHKVAHFTWKDYFKNYQYASAYKTDGNKLKSIYYRLQNKTTFGPALLKLNNDLVNKCIAEKPDLLFIYRGTHIYACTIKRIKKLGVKVFGYNNDDPFSTVYRPYFWRHFIKSVPDYDHIFYYRYKNEADYKALGYYKTSMLRSSYIKENNFKIEDTKNSPFSCDVIFVGHYENDDRDLAIMKLMDANIDFKLYGTGWQASVHYDYIQSKLGDIKPLYDADYNMALNSAKIALVFLSKINNDTYTRRCFEIPATGTTMLSEYTKDLADDLFIENKEAVYFKNHADLLKQVYTYLQDDALRQKIAEGGYKKVHSAGHEVTDRVAQIIKEFESV